MFRVYFIDEDRWYRFEDADSVANFIFDTIGDWLLASGVRNECHNVKPGDAELDLDYEDYGFVIRVSQKENVTDAEPN